MLLEPGLACGVIVGVLLNRVSPKWLITALLVATLGSAFMRTGQKALTLWRKETEKKADAISKSPPGGHARARRRHDPVPVPRGARTAPRGDPSNNRPLRLLVVKLGHVPVCAEESGAAGLRDVLQRRRGRRDPGRADLSSHLDQKVRPQLDHRHVHCWCSHRVLSVDDVPRHCGHDVRLLFRSVHGNGVLQALPTVKFYGLRFTAEPPSTASFAATAPPRAPTRNFARGHFEHSGSALPCERE